MIPIRAIQSVAKVESELKLTDAQKVKYADYLQNQFQIFLKDEFLDFYLRNDYEEVMIRGTR